MSAENAPVAAAPAGQQIQLKGLTLDVVNDLFLFLDTCPHGQVRKLIDSLSSAPTFNATVTPQPAAAPAPPAAA